MKLSENFKLEEFTRSDTALKNGIVNIPDTGVKSNLSRLSKDFLQPLRDYAAAKYGKATITISSGYRCEELNIAVKGSPISQHMNGNAADIYINIDGTRLSKNSALSLVKRFIKETGTMFDQVIHYKDQEIIHVGLSDNMRNQFLSNYR